MALSKFTTAIPNILKRNSCIFEVYIVVRINRPASDRSTTLVCASKADAFGMVSDGLLELQFQIHQNKCSCSDEIPERHATKLTLNVQINPGPWQMCHVRRTASPIFGRNLRSTTSSLYRWSSINQPHASALPIFENN